MGFRVQGSGSRVYGSGFRVQGLGFWVLGSGFRVHALRPTKPTVGARSPHASRPRVAPASELWTQRLGFRFSFFLLGSGVRAAGLGSGILGGGGYRFRALCTHSQALKRHLSPPDPGCRHIRAELRGGIPEVVVTVREGLGERNLRRGVWRLVLVV